MKKALKLVVGCLILGSMLFAKEVDIKILGTSDVHGRISPWDYSTDMKDYSGGYAQISTLVKDYRKTNDNIILVDLGDSIQDNGI
jgi:2',3'-cyclic-nucleotide 2'-phosphodiesterase/3'-nucleotidase